MALVIILLRAGLSLDINDLKKIGRPALLMAFIPSLLEIVGIIILAPLLLGFNYIYAFILATILAAVSPAIVVPRMIKMINSNNEKKKQIGQMVIAGASLDYIFVIVLFTLGIEISKTGVFSLTSLLLLPVSLVFGVLTGLLVGLFSIYLFKKVSYRDTSKVLLLLSASLFFITLESLAIVPFSGLIATLSLGITWLTKYPKAASRLVTKYEKIWVISEMLLFILVGAIVDITLLPTLGFMTLVLILGGLLFRSLGVLLSTHATSYTFSERSFMIMAYIPKATVQASVGAIPLMLGLSSGNEILGISVLSIVLTAPVGAFLIDRSMNKL